MDIDIESSIGEVEQVMLRRFAQGKWVLEIGAAFGFTTILMAQGAELVVSVDPHDATNLRPGGTLTEFLDNLDHYGVRDRVRVYVDRIENVWKRLPRHAFGFIFVDGDHAYASVLRDAKIAEGLCAEDGQIAFHDYGYEDCPEVRPAVDAWLHDSLWRVATQVESLLICER
jgi:predicted O-methyltransferase YrrM